MVRWASILVLSATLGGAPFQCGSESDPASALEETPGEALYELAEQFKRRGDQAAWRGTLTYLIERYPASRFAVTAKSDLRAAEAAAATEVPAEKPAGRPSRTAASPQ